MTTDGTSSAPGHEMPLRDADGYPRVVIRMSPAEYARICEAAEREHLPASTWLRHIVLLYLDGMLPKLNTRA
jgi:hypothetical protein